jgi:hypothetical protein
MLPPMIFLTFIAAIFHEIAAIAILQFDVINSCDAAVSAHSICLGAAATHYFAD